MTILLTICGSLRDDSFNRALIGALPAHAPDGVEFRDAPSYAGLPHYDADGHQSAGIPQGVMDIGAAVSAADGVVIVSPEYNWSIPGGLKNALDWISRIPDQPFAGKPVLLQSATAGPLGGARMQYHLRMVLTFLNAHIFGTPEIFVGSAQDKFDPSTRELTDGPTKAILTRQLAGFEKYIGAMTR